MSASGALLRVPRCRRRDAGGEWHGRVLSKSIFASEMHRHALLHHAYHPGTASRRHFHSLARVSPHNQLLSAALCTYELHMQCTRANVKARPVNV